MEREELTKEIGKNIRKLRLKKDISQEALSMSAGLHPAYLGRLERGEKCPTIDTMYKICNALDVTVSEILCFEGETENPNAQAKTRIENALKKIPDKQQIKVAEIIEKIAEITDAADKK